MNPLKLPLSSSLADFHAAGIHLKSKHQIEWQYRRRHENGLAEAFKKVGRTRIVDVPKYHELVSASTAG